MNEPQIALFMTVRNREQYFDEAVESILRQSFPRDKFVHILLDNNSEKSLVKKEEAYAEKYDHIELIKFNENRNQLGAYNYGIKYVQEKYPSVRYYSDSDSDDRCGIYALEKCYDALETTPDAVGCFTRFNVIDHKGRLEIKDHKKSKIIPPNDTSEECQKKYRRFHLNTNAFTHHRMFRMNTIINAGYFPEEPKFSTDFNLYAFMMTQGPIIGVDAICYNWRRHKKGGSQVEQEHSREQQQNLAQLQKYYRKRWTEMGLI